MLPMTEAHADREPCDCGAELRIWWNCDADHGLTLTVYHGDGEACRTWPCVDVCTWGYARWLAEVHAYERTLPPPAAEPTDAP
jgi:hypothetical protein